MQIKFVTTEEKLSQRMELMLEADRLLAKIARLTTLYQAKLYKIRKKIQELEKL